LAAPDSLRLALPKPSDVPPWYRLTGHAEGHYSLAVVNRGLLRALSQAHPEHVALKFRDGTSTSLSANAPQWLQQLGNLRVPPEAADSACSIVHHYPLIADPLPAKLRFALFFWEETAVPAAMVGHLETHFDAVLVASQFVKRALRNSGCSLPIQVIPLGVDHLLAPDAAMPTNGSRELGQSCRFLHVSSAFERKGPDLLLQAWLRQFSGDDPVDLYIKTFPNPHNRIHALWTELSATHPNPPRVIIDEEALDEAQMLALYRSAQAMVLPTRGEGFNLPAAEAMALGIALLVTGHGAHADFCNLETAALIPFLFAASGSHLRTSESCWVEPDLDSLAEQLGILYREISADAPSLQRRRTAALQHVRQTYSWSRSADAIDRFAAVLNKQASLTQKSPPATDERINLHLLSPWNTACGIAEYARGLISAFSPDRFRIHFDCDTRTSPAKTDVADEPSYTPTWTLGDGPSVVRALRQIGERAKSGDVVLVQHQPALFRLDTAICEQLSQLSQQGLVVLLEMHATRPLLDHQRPPLEALAALRLLDRIIVHHLDDMNHLLMLGLDNNLMQIPLGVIDPLPPSQAASRASLGLPDDALILASFGFLHPHKGIDQIIAALPVIAAKVGRKVCLLAINALPDPSRHQLQQQYQQLAAALGVAGDVYWITDYQDIGQSQRQLACADFILYPYANTQESASAAVTIGLATSRPVLVSNQPIFADLSEITWRMNGHDAAAIAQAVCTLHADPALAQALQARQHEWLGQRSLQNISARLARAVIGCHRDKTLSAQLTPAIESLQVSARQPQLLVDISELYFRDARTGIQRVVRNILQELQHGLTSPNLVAYQVLPVFGVSGQGYCHTRRFDQTVGTANNLPQENEAVQPEVGDIFLGLDLSAHLFPEAENWLRDYRRRGVAIHFVVYDIIPLRNPQWTAPGMPEAFGRWLLSIARQSNRLLCISATVAADVHDWLVQHAPEQTVPDIASFPLGADLLPQSLAPTPVNQSPLPDLQGRLVFLSVSTIEPRKGQAQTLAAFEQLWAQGQDIVLVLVGKVGWMMDQFVTRLSHHPENGHRLFWLQGLSDTALEQVYARSTALIAASEAEGFGLPLIEAARHRLPILARNIPVFREVAGRHAFYFDGLSAGGLARAIQYWQLLRQQQHHPASDGMHWLNWQQSAQHLQTLLKAIKPVAGSHPP
jgi:glycosyltransferase involved in cell wall biosynthesis